jgi:hypothetical protein
VEVHVAAYQLALVVLLISGVAAIVFLGWVLVHLHMEGEKAQQPRMNRTSMDLQKARTRIESSWAPNDFPGIGRPGQSMVKGRILRRMAAKKIPPQMQELRFRDSRVPPVHAQSPRKAP